MTLRSQRRILEKPDKVSSYFLNQYILLVFLFIVGVLYNFGLLVVPYIQGQLIDGVESLTKSGTTDSIWRICPFYLIAIIVTQIARAMKRYLVRLFAQNTLSSMRLVVYNNIMNLPLSELEKTDTGTYINRNMSDINKTVEGFRKVLTEIFDTLILFVFYIAYLFVFDVKTTGFALISVLTAVLISFLLRKLSFKYAVEARKANATLSSLTFDYIDNALLYRIYGRGKDNNETYEKSLIEYEKANRKSLILTDMTMPLTNGIALIGLFPIIYIIGGYVSNQTAIASSLISNGNNVWTIGLFSSYLSIFVLLSNKTSHIAKLFSSFENGVASWKRIKPHMKTYSEYKKGKDIDIDEITLVNYSLKSRSRTLIDDISFKLKRGEIIGITGPIASGKSLFGKTFIGRYSYDGELLINRKDLKEYSMEDINASIGYMGHDTTMFTDTIESNIQFDQKNDVFPYLEMVSFEKDLESMPDKEKTIIGNEGVRLSGGQRQRIALARTLYSKKKVLILDDPFSSVDKNTEAKIMKSIMKAKDDSIIILISHRLSCFPLLDKVILLDGKGNSFIGTHESLYKENSLYHELFDIQKEVKENE